VRNVLDQRPSEIVHGHALFVRSFVPSVDLRDRDVLDVGCGFGWFELVALDAGARTVIGIEPTAADLATARREIDDERVTFLEASVLELPFEDGTVDTAVMWEVLEHVPKGTEPAAFRELARVIRPGGRLFLSTPHSAAAARGLDPAWWVAGHRHYSLADVEALVRDAGFDVETLELRGGWWQQTYMLNLYVAKWIFRRRPFFEQRFLSRLDREWTRDGQGFAHVVARCRRR
jgi:2-polyprenyl-3-methyl-5-hydroxy-6-metoxy-1,4-benzoquinol methylase